MRLTKRIGAIWLLTIAALLMSFLIPHAEVSAVGFISNALQFLLFTLSLYLVKYETVRKTRFLFVNFATLFGMGFLFHLYNFVGTIVFPHDPMARHYYFQYVSNALYFFLLAFSVCYVTIDVLFRDFRIFQKYLLTAAIVGGFFLYYYLPYFSNADYLYTTVEIAEWKELDKAYASFKKELGEEPSAEDLAAHIRPSQAPLLSRLDDQERTRRVLELFPYLEGANYKNILFKPLYMNTIKMCVLTVGLILLFFGYLYRKDPPQGAYIEKMMFFFLMSCTLEIFHAWSFIKTVEWRLSLQLFEVGQFLSAFVLALIAVFFALRLRFITSAYGEFYEQEIVEHPTGITRWRDAVDNMVIAHFFQRNELVGRMFVNPKWKKP